MDFREVIARYYSAFRYRNREELEEILTPDFHFVSGFGEFRDRDAMLDAIWPSVGGAWATNLRIFGDTPDFVVLYEHELAPGVHRPRMAMAEHIRFSGDRIGRLEVFTGRQLPDNTESVAAK